MEKRIVSLGVLLVFAAMAHAAVYEWEGHVDNDWWNGGNWTVTGSSAGWTYPNDEDDGAYSNRDCTEINITNGGTVDGGYSGSHGYLSVDGERDGSTTNVMTISNGSTVNDFNAIWIV